MCYPEDISVAKLGVELDINLWVHQQNGYEEYEDDEERIYDIQIEESFRCNQASDVTNPDRKALEYRKRLDDIHRRLYFRREEEAKEPFLVLGAFRFFMTKILMEMHQNIVDDVPREVFFKPSLRFLQYFVKNALPIRLDFNSWVGRILINEIAKRHKVDSDLIMYHPEETDSELLLTYEGPGFHEDSDLCYDLLVIHVVLQNLGGQVRRYLVNEAYYTEPANFEDNPSLADPMRPILWDKLAPNPIYHQFASGVLGWRWFDLPWTQEYF